MCALPVDSPFSIIADDLTGAMDVAAPFAALGHTAFVSRNGSPGPVESRVRSVDLQTRRMAPADAAPRVDSFARQTDALAMVKADSAMRGHFGLEAVVAALSTGGEPVADVVFCPAFPRNGRTVVDGVVQVDGIPLDRSDVGRDRLTPIVSSSVAETINRNAGVDVLGVSLSEVRSGGLTAMLTAGADSPRFLSVDAVDDSDLDRIIEASLAIPQRVLLCGSAGLASALARSLPGPGAPALAPSIDRPVLLITASQRDVTARQMDALEQKRGMPHFRLEFRGGSRTDVSPALAAMDAIRGRRDAILSVRLLGLAAERPADHAEALLSILRETIAVHAQSAHPGSLFLVGGDTADAVLEAVGADGIVLHAEPLPGVALGNISGGEWHGVPIAAKSGAFGDATTLVKLYDQAQENDPG